MGGRWKLCGALFLVAIVSACASVSRQKAGEVKPQTPVRAESDQLKPPAEPESVKAAPAPQKHYVLVPVYYGTDRKWEGSSGQNNYYGGKRGTGLALGVCAVSIPKTHKPGEMETPAWWRLEFSWDPKKHIMLQKVEPLDPEQFKKRLAGAMSGASKKEALVFIHGYKNSFEDAARRTAQMAYDLEFGGVAAFFSWPSLNEDLKYTFDENNVEWAIPHLEEFLNVVAKQSGAEKVYLIAHSMGNRALTRALLALETGREKPLFKEIILAAPDVDAQVFTRDIVPVIKNTGHVTLYASDKDKALAISSGFHGDYPRAGQEKGLEGVDGIDVIDAASVDTSLLGHSYIADNVSILTDVFLLIGGNREHPAQRCLTRPKGATAWRIDPEAQKECLHAVLGR